jgi:hypothetical protein
MFLEPDVRRSRISRRSPGCSGSLLAALVAQPQCHDHVPFAWQHPHCAKLPPRLREMLDHAQNFFEVMQGAPLLYNLMLAEQARRNESVEKYRRSFGQWAKSISARARALAQWDRKRFWEIIRSVNPGITAPTHEFVNGWWDSAFAGNAERLCDSPSARLLIRDRERRLKKNLARLDNPGAQELWTGDSGTSQLEFRWFITQRLPGDIFDGLEAVDA